MHKPVPQPPDCTFTGALRVEQGRPAIQIGHDPKGDPHGFIAWVDYGRGVIPEGTVNYAWGDMDTKQTYARIIDVLLLA